MILDPLVSSSIQNVQARILGARKEAIIEESPPAQDQIRITLLGVPQADDCEGLQMPLQSALDRYGPQATQETVIARVYQLT